MKKYKRVVWVLVVALLFSIIYPASMQAAEGEDTRYRDEVLENYEDYREAVLGLSWLVTDKDYHYERLADSIKNSSGLIQAGMKTAYFALGENLTEEDCQGYLMVVMQITKSGIHDGLLSQSEYDATKKWQDYVVDAEGIAADFIVGQKVADRAKKVQTAIGINANLLKALVDTKELAIQYQRVAAEYSSQKYFLEAIAEYTDEKELKAAADTLLELIDYQLAYNLEMVYKEEKIAGKMLLDMEEDLISESFLEWMNEKKKGMSSEAAKKLGKLQGVAQKEYQLYKRIKLAADIAVFVGDLSVGNEYRYLKEVMMMDKMASALQKAIDKSSPDREISKDSRYEAIEAQVPLLCALCGVRVRGEYCANMMAKGEHTFLKILADNKEELDAYYQKALEFLQKEYQQIQEILIVDDFTVTLMWHEIKETYDRSSGELQSDIRGLYPSVSYPGGDKATEKMEEVLEAAAREHMEYYRTDTYWTDPNADPPMFDSYNFAEMNRIPETRMDENVISIAYYVTTYYAGAAHPLHGSMCYNFDTKTGEQITLADVIIDQTAYQSLCDLVYEKLSEGMDTANENVVGNNARSELQEYGLTDCYKYWYFTTEGLCISYSPYQIASYAAGFIEPVIPYSQLKGIVKDEYLQMEPRSEKGVFITAEASERIDITEARNVICCDGPGDCSRQVGFTSDEIIYDVDFYETESINAELTYASAGKPLISISSLSPNTRVLIQCGVSREEKPNLYVNWTDGDGNRHTSLYGVDSQGELLEAYIMQQ